MKYAIIEKARPHKYIKRTGMPGKYEYTYGELLGGKVPIDEPWRITQKEFVDSRSKGAMALDVFDALSIHKDDVERAVKEGKPVPPEVLKDYQWSNFPLRTDIGEQPTAKDTPPRVTSNGDFILYHGTSDIAANQIIQSRTIKPDDIGSVGIATIPEAAETYATHKIGEGKPTILEVIVDKNWLSKQQLRHEIGGHGHSAFLINPDYKSGVKATIPPEAIKGIKVYDRSYNYSEGDETVRRQDEAISVGNAFLAGIPGSPEITWGYLNKHLEKPYYRGLFRPETNKILIAGDFSFRTPNDFNKTIKHEIAEWLEWKLTGEVTARYNIRHSDDSKFMALRSLVRRSYPDHPEKIVQLLETIKKAVDSDIKPGVVARLVTEGDYKVWAAFPKRTRPMRSYSKDDEAEKELDRIVNELTDSIWSNMKFVVIEKARSHKYIRRLGMPGKYEYFYEEPGKYGGIELSPQGTERIGRYREEAKQRIKEWRGEAKPVVETWRKQSIQFSDEQILWEGYKWRDGAHKRGHGWDWAMWEEIQKLAKEKGFTYKEKFTKQEILDNPGIPDVDDLLGKTYQSDEITTNWRNHPNRRKMWEFINSSEGQIWATISRRELWGYIKTMSKDDIDKTYPGLIGLKNANSWEEVLNTDIDVYRGIPEETEKFYGGKHFISYTVVPAMADKFARGYYHSYDAGEGKGIVVKRRIKFGEVLGFVNNDGENEVLVKPPRKGQHIPLVGPERVIYERRDKTY